MSLAVDFSYWPTAATRHGGAVAQDSCAASPSAPPKEWVYKQAAIGFVTSGWFEYATEGTSTLAAPGSVVLGNAGDHFSVRHLDTRGNDRLVVLLDEHALNDIANDCDLDDTRFSAIAVPPGPKAARMFGWIRAYAEGGARAEEALYPLAQTALTTTRPIRRPITPRDRRRVEAAARYIEANFNETCTLQTLAGVANLSRFHFVRTFGAVIGQSPNQYLINTRIRIAAERLLSTRTPIAELALDVGFNDLSHFYACFRQAFDCTPRQWREGRRS
jgi:AraC family transcriptional regulator